MFLKLWVSKFSIFLVIAIFLITVVFNLASAREITVNDNGSDADFKSIQEAVNNSSPGDTILVYQGIYNESVDIWVRNTSIFSENQNPENTLVRDFDVSANNVTVNGFSIQENLALQGINGDFWQAKIENCTVKNNILESGIYADDCCNSTIESNVVLNSGIGVYGPDEDSNFSISDNIIVDGDIIVSHGPSNCVLLNNTLLRGGIGLASFVGYCKILDNYISAGMDNGHGIVLFETSSNEIENNTIENCTNGILLTRLTGSNTVYNNTLRFNDRGVCVEDSGGNSFINNDISNNNVGMLLSGFTVDQAGANSVLNNTISNNNIGISLKGDSSGNLVTNNKVELNKQYGVYIKQVSYETLLYNGTNWFYNNKFNNKINFFNDTDNYTGNYYAAKPTTDGSRANSANFNTTKTSGTNIMNGSYLGGNYWAKPDGTGFSQICSDSDGDGIGDLPYYITDNDIDYLPLVSLSRSQETIIPFANFSTNATQNLAPLTVQFADFSQNAVAWNWDFDNNGIYDSTNQNPVYVYTTPGTYIVNLTASNGKETSSKTQKIIVQEATVPPIADFSANVTSGQVPLSVRFTDLSQNATSRVWDFNNDGNFDSAERTPDYMYTYPGNYTVNLTVSNTKGTVSISFPIVVYPAQRSEGELILTEYQITTNESNQECPAINGDRIVWQDNRDGNYTLYLYNISTSSETPIVSDYPQFDPAIYGDKIVWQSGNIYLYNFSTSLKAQITNQSGRYPAIYDNKIVWERSHIYMYDLSTLKESQITNNNNTSYQEHPAIFSNRIVWGDWRNRNWDIYMYDLSTQKEFQITANKSDQASPAIYGDRIVWVDSRNGNPNIYMYNLSSSRETRITTNQSGQYWPAIYEDRIVWEDSRSGNGSDIYMYDFSISKEIQITASGSASNPAIYNNRIVWQDRRNGNSDIYMCTISRDGHSLKTPVSDFFANITSGNAPLRVLFTDSSTGAPIYWYWDFGDGINSKHALNSTHTFLKPGKYDVSLTVTNENGSNTKIIPEYITVSESK